MNSFIIDLTELQNLLISELESIKKISKTHFVIKDEILAFIDSNVVF